MQVHICRQFRSGLIIYEALPLQVFRWLKMSERDFLFLMGIKVESVKFFQPSSASPSAFNVDKYALRGFDDGQTLSSIQMSNRLQNEFGHFFALNESIRSGKKNKPNRCLQRGQNARCDIVRNHSHFHRFNSFYR